MNNTINNDDYEIMLTTIDNPFDPFEDFDNWNNFDQEKGYDCCGKLARVARISDQLSDEENEKEIERAIDEIITYDFFDIYKKVTRLVPKIV